MKGKLREIESILYPDEVLSKKAKVQFDGKQFLVRIPKEVSDFLKIKKGHEFIFEVVIPSDTKKQPETRFKVRK